MHTFFTDAVRFSDQSAGLIHLFFSLINLFYFQTEEVLPVFTDKRPAGYTKTPFPCRVYAAEVTGIRQFCIHNAADLRNIFSAGGGELFTKSAALCFFRKALLFCQR
jgi:hypothetical protein